MRKIDRTGETKTNVYGSEMVIEKYNNRLDVIVRFLDTDTLVSTTYQSFEKGSTVNPYNRTVYNNGFIGEGKYKPSENSKLTKPYVTWSSMLQRCYSELHNQNHPTYIDCSASEEWHNFQTFATWYDNNYYDIEGERMCLDKDILIKGNKIYSPDTCVFVPQGINALFVKANGRRGILPIGVIVNNHKTKKYTARCNDGKGKMININSYHTPEEAFQSYKKFKELTIKEIAEEYKSLIPNILYNALINYKVEIGD